VAIAVTSSVLVIPQAIWGYAPTHDFAFHVRNWMEVAGQWREGIVLPSWSAHANFGYGDPRFIFYPPISWLLGGACALALPAKVVPAVFVWVSLMVAGISMFFLCRDWLADRYAVQAAVLYQINPYEVVLVYKRMAAGELLAAGLFPLLLLFALRIVGESGPNVATREPRRRWNAVIAFAVVHALVWLSNPPGAVICSYALAFLFVVLGAYERSPRALVRGAVGLVIGMALAAVYIVPATWEQPWVNIAFAQAHPGPDGLALSPDGRRFPFAGFFIRLIPANTPAKSIIGVGFTNLMLAAAALAVALRRPTRHPQASRAVALLAAFGGVVTLPMSLPLWLYLPRMMFVQFPFRWLFVVNAATVFVLALAALPGKSAKVRWVVLAVGVLVGLVLVGVYGSEGRPGQVEEVLAMTVRDGGYVAETAYLPPGEARHAASRFWRAIESASPQATAVRLVRRNAHTVVFDSDARVSTTVRLNLAWYPAWRVRINRIAAALLDDHGQVAVKVPAGTNTIEVGFERTRDRDMGSAISVLALITVLGVSWKLLKGRDVSNNL
jgi:hypothetical protein